MTDSNREALFSIPMNSSPKTDVHEVCLSNFPYLMHNCFYYYQFKTDLNDCSCLHCHKTNKNDEEISLCTKSESVHCQNIKRPSISTSVRSVQYTPTIDVNDSMPTKYLYQASFKNFDDVQDDLTTLLMLCNTKDQKIAQLENLWEDYQEKYDNDVRELKYKLEFNERKKRKMLFKKRKFLLSELKCDFEQRCQLVNTQNEELLEKNDRLHRTIQDEEIQIQQLEAVKIQVFYLYHFY